VSLSIRLRVKSRWLISVSVKCDGYPFRRLAGAGLGEIFVQPQGAGDAFFVVGFVREVVAAQGKVLLKRILANGRHPRRQFFTSISSFGE
uniref:hypothetical protein n=1 Tax=Salmonella enterica TaxID=28901 RepID=UPI001C390BAC